MDRRTPARLFMGHGAASGLLAVGLLVGRVHFALTSKMGGSTRVLLLGGFLLLLLRVTTTTNEWQIDVATRLGLTKPKAKVARIVHSQAHVVASVSPSHAEPIVTHQIYQRLPVVFAQGDLAGPDPLAQVFRH